MAYTDDYIEKSKGLALELGLFDASRYAELTNDEIRAQINGVGSAAMPEILRNALDALHKSMVLPSHIHDCQWGIWCDGSYDSFLTSNWKFEMNCRKVAAAMYPWYDPRRYTAYRRARQFHKILDEFGTSAYNAALAARARG